MPDDPTKPTPPADPTKPDPKPGDLGDAGKKAIDTEREARKAAEARTKELEAEFGAMKTALAEAFGVKPDPKNKDADVLATIQQQLAGLQRDNTVLALANEHQITDKDDINLLRESRLEGDALAAMATRLKPAENKPGTPKPDASQGSKGEPTKPDALPGVPRMAQAFDDAMNN